VLEKEATGVPGAPQVHSRALFPGWAVPEDTVTGSAHCSLAVLHSPLFGGAGIEVRCTQGYGPIRTGALKVVWDGKPGKEGGRVKLRGNAVTVAEGKLFV
jgi:predicted PhzF superfamily epimerase YddE/YHI9